MALLKTAELLRAFTTNVNEADRVDIAVAWLGPSRALDELLRRAARGQLQARVVVGLSGNGTSPIALRSLQKAGAQIRVASSSIGLFHPKFYLFRAPERNICWIGSSNFTLPGFAQNSELIHEFTDDGNALLWFEDVWTKLPAESDDTIDQYAQNWTRRPPVFGKKAWPIRLPQGSLPKLLTSIESWDEYIAGLHTCDAYWKARAAHEFGYSFSVLGDGWSWVDTIVHGSDIARRQDWENLTEVEKRILLGIETKDAAGAWGLLGNMRAAVTAVGEFYEDAGVRMRIRKELQMVMNASNDEQFLQTAVQAARAIAQLNGFGLAVATRLIALARPDRGISVNGGSAPQLSRLTGLPATASILANEQNYPNLLRWLYDQQWYRAGEPSDAFEQIIWSMRAALIDCFVYVRV
jgi:HKD family nuclease